jgi:chitodextrinase
VTPFVTGNGTYSFGLAQTASDGVDYRSREYTTTVRPELVLTVSADSQKPTPPRNLVATGGAGQVALSWNASSDNVRVTGYRVYRGTTQIANLGTTARSYTDTGLAAGSYLHRARRGRGGNLSDPSNSATGPCRTQPSRPHREPDRERRHRPGRAELERVHGQRQGDRVQGLPRHDADRRPRLRCDHVHGQPSGAGLLQLHGPGDRRSHESLRSEQFGQRHRAGHHEPTKPGNLSATASAGQVALRWNASSDDVGVTGYRIYRGADWIASVTGGTTSFTDTASPPDRTATPSGPWMRPRISDPSDAANATVPDTTNPTAPGNLRANAGTGEVVLRWNSSSDDVGVTGYRICRGGTEIASVGDVTTYTDTNLAPGPYSYTVRPAMPPGTSRTKQHRLRHRTRRPSRTRRAT